MSEAWSNRPATNDELLAAEREANRRFRAAKKAGVEHPQPFILFLRFDKEPIPEQHRSHLYKDLHGLSFSDGIEAVYRAVIGVGGKVRSYDLDGYRNFRF